MGPQQVLTLWVWVNLGVMSIEKYSSLPKISRVGFSLSGPVKCYTQEIPFGGREVQPHSKDTVIVF